ncbi:Uracil DNA glycosylase superfamily protein [Rickettsiales bacterium Ac37b]|nr:Uracil DNA glycosylase superfamily protein [Rickettsiales bacterium Ac37b]
MPITTLLKWYHQMGVDEIVSNNTHSLLQNSINEEKKIHVSQNIPDIKHAKPVTHFTPVLDIIKHSKNLVENCHDLSKLEQIVKEFDGCILKKTATNTVFCDGNNQAEIMFIGEAPGANEDLQGIPFCGASGILLDNMLEYIDLSRKKNIYISNSIFWRPPGNRRPTPEEIAMCLPFVEKHIALVNPKLLVLVGATAVSSLLATTEAVSKLRSRIHEYSNDYLNNPIPTIVIYHPSYLLRQPSQKRLVWQDLLKMREFIDQNGIIVN